MSDESLTKITVETRKPEKWRFWDLETGQIWIWQDNKFVLDRSAKPPIDNENGDHE